MLNDLQYLRFTLLITFSYSTWSNLYANTVTHRLPSHLLYVHCHTVTAKSTVALGYNNRYSTADKWCIQAERPQELTLLCFPPRLELSCAKLFIPVSVSGISNEYLKSRVDVETLNYVKIGPKTQISHRDSNSRTFEFKFVTVKMWYKGYCKGRPIIWWIAWHRFVLMHRRLLVVIRFI